ncbi:MAG: cobalamin B12-binding domain-containing protein [Proteobacteria bacterium]|nr:cobalamin B12-binding domain-containing protein [Pseudomonadota bacterium]
MRADRDKALAGLPDDIAASVIAGALPGGWDGKLEAAERDHAVAELSATLHLDVLRRLTHLPVPADAVVPTADQVDSLARLTLGQDDAACQRYVEALRLNGVGIDAVYLQLITPAARLLGQMWADDLCTFIDVTIGIARLQQIVRTLGPAFLGDGGRAAHDRRAVLMSVPGEQHTFGLLMAAEFLRRAGWVLDCATPANNAGAATIVRSGWFCFVGFSLSTEGRIGALSACIRGIRKSSMNRKIGVLVGGNVFLEHPDLVRRVGADAMAEDGLRAVVAAQHFLQLGADARV